MALTRGRIVRAEGALPARVPPIAEKIARRVAKEELDARARAAKVLEQAHTEASRVIADATNAAASAVAAAAAEAAEHEQAKLAASFLALRAREEARATAELDHAVELARVLAERILGATLTLDPSSIVSMARQALTEAQGARTVRIDAHPEDATVLRAQLSAFAPLHATVTDDASLARGSLRLHTDLGTLDARLPAQLERLAAALRDALRTA
ncbi:MAG TPA: FliH/SctL family protein [Polyangiaceae bacterium]